MAAHRTIGLGFVVGSAVALITAPVVLVVATDAIGPAVVTGSIVMLAPVVVGVVAGINRLQTR